MASIFISAPCVEARVQFRSCLSGYAYPYLSFQHVFCYIALCIAACLMLSIFTDGSSFLCVSYVSTHILLLFLGGWHAQFCRLHTDAGSLISQRLLNRSLNRSLCYTQYPIIRNGDQRWALEFLKNYQFPDADRFLILQGWALAVS